MNNDYMESILFTNLNAVVNRTDINQLMEAITSEFEILAFSTGTACVKVKSMAIAQQSISTYNGCYLDEVLMVVSLNPKPIIEPEVVSSAVAVTSKNVCFFGDKCTRVDCIFIHPEGMKTKPKQRPSCHFQKNCMNPNCNFDHTAPISQLLIANPDGTLNPIRTFEHTQAAPISQLPIVNPDRTLLDDMKSKIMPYMSSGKHGLLVKSLSKRMKIFEDVSVNRGLLENVCDKLYEDGLLQFKRDNYGRKCYSRQDAFSGASISGKMIKILKTQKKNPKKKKRQLKIDGTLHYDQSKIVPNPGKKKNSVNRKVCLVKRCITNVKISLMPQGVKPCHIMMMQKNVKIYGMMVHVKI